jgi:hypothetical protein
LRIVAPEASDRWSSIRALLVYLHVHDPTMSSPPLRTVTSFEWSSTEATASSKMTVPEMSTKSKSGDCGRSKSHVSPAGIVTPEPAVHAAPSVEKRLAPLAAAAVWGH